MSKARQEKAQRDEESRPAPLLYEEKTMREKLKKLFAYYNPYKPLFYSDMFFAILGAAVTLILPLIVRYITNEVVYFNGADARRAILVHYDRSGAAGDFLQLLHRLFWTHYGSEDGSRHARGYLRPLPETDFCLL